MAQPETTSISIEDPSRDDIVARLGEIESAIKHWSAQYTLAAVLKVCELTRWAARLRIHLIRS